MARKSSVMNRGGTRINGEFHAPLESSLIDDPAYYVNNKADAASAPPQLSDAEYLLKDALDRAKSENERLRERIDELEDKIHEIESATDWKPGWVYLIKELSNGHCKIGKTTNVDDRLHTFGVKLPFKIEFICTIRAKNYHQLEKDLHGMFALKHAGGEWYMLSDEDIDFIRSLAQGD